MKLAQTCENLDIEFAIINSCLVSNIMLLANFSPIFVIYLLYYLSQSLDRTPYVQLIQILIFKQEIQINLELQELIYQERPKIDHFWATIRHNLNNM